MNLDIADRGFENLSNAVNDFVAEGGPALSSDDRRAPIKQNWKEAITHLAPEIRARLMAKYAITYNGRHFEKGGYRYDLLADAVIHAKLKRSSTSRDPGYTRSSDLVEEPTSSQRRLMSKLNIKYQDGLYLFGAYRYERLDDAVDYAHLKWRLPI